MSAATTTPTQAAVPPSARLAASRIGGVSARITVVLGALYLPTLALGFASSGLDRPLPDPFLAVAEVLILLMAPPLVALVAALLVLAPPERRVWGLCAFGFTLLLAGTTVPVHVLELVVARRLEPGPPHGIVFGWDWPGILYAVDVTAWDLFFGIALIAAALTLTGPGSRTARSLLLVSGALALVGLTGPALGIISLRLIGVVGYAAVFPVAAAALGRLLITTGRPGTFGPGPDAAPTRSSTS